MNEPRIEDYLDDLERNLRLSVEFTETTTIEEFQKDFRNQYAVIRALEIVGESVKRIPEDIRALEPRMPWKAMAGMRDRLIHGYDNVNIGLVWATVSTTIPALLPLFSSFREKVEQAARSKD